MIVGRHLGAARASSTGSNGRHSRLSPTASPTKGWVEYGAIDDAIIEKLKDDEDVRVLLQGAEELHSAIRGMKDVGPLLPQMRLFLNFLDSMLEEQNFKMNRVKFLRVWLHHND